MEDQSCTINSQYLVADGTGHLVVDTGTSPSFNRLNVAAGATAGLTPGATVTRTFHVAGRYMVNCDNRAHFILAPYMFGFVNVVNCGANHP